MQHPPKRRPPPHVLDLVEPLRDIRASREIIALRPVAKRFVFDAEGSRHLGAFIRECGDLIVANRQFAIPPFETTYLQCELDETIAAIGRGSSVDRLGNREGRDTQVGYLIHKRRVYSMSADAQGRASPGVFAYERDTPSGPGPIFEEPVQIGDSDDEWARLALLLGTTMDADVFDEETRLDIIRSHRVTVAERARHISRMQRSQQVQGSMGDIRNVWAMLLLINQKRSAVRLHDVPWQAALWKGRRRVYGAHSVVRINLTGPKQTMRQLMRPSLHAPRSAHGVKGHFAHYHLRDGCAHPWPLMPEVSESGIARWRCPACSGWRTWKRDYTTGDGAVGYVTKEYRLTSGRTE